jgi:hypothetical protein
MTYDSQYTQHIACDLFHNKRQQVYRMVRNAGFSVLF